MAITGRKNSAHTEPKQETFSISKITRPRISGVIERKRLFKLLDRSGKKPIIWVSAPAGSGKTTLISSYLDACKLPCIWYQVDEGDADISTFFYYMGLAAKKAAPRYRKSLPLLTPEYLMGIPTFTKRYFEELYRRIADFRLRIAELNPKSQIQNLKSFVIVLDNYQDVNPESQFHEIINNGLSIIPEGIKIMVISRAEPPPHFARLRANNKMSFIGWDEIRFTPPEAKEIIKKHATLKLKENDLMQLYSETDGWIAGLILLLERMKTGSDSPSPIKKIPRDNIFDYFASEIFNKAGASAQDVLLKTSFLQRIDPTDAEQLTENGMAGQILERLNCHHYFTQKYDEAYHYHPLFREFLQSRAKNTFSETDVARIQVSAAGLLEKSGRVEEAIGLFIESRDWGQAERLILSQASALASQGRSATLAGWLKSFPQDHIDKAPWLLYWSGICRMAFDPSEARVWLEKAFGLFKPKSDRTGAFLSWASIIDTFVYEWGDFSPLDYWIAMMGELLSEHPAFPSPEIEVRVAAGMLSAMTNRQPGRADISQWAERVERILFSSSNIPLRMLLGNHLMFYYLWVGDFSKAALVIEASRPSGAADSRNMIH